MEEYLEEFIRQALQEDVGEGDHTSLSTIPDGRQAQAKLLVKEQGILAGVAVAKQVFSLVDPTLDFREMMRDGDIVANGDIALEISGSARSILTAERLVLNIMQRMSGIATTTNLYAQRIAHTKAKVLDTRKTTPNMRMLEKEAVRIGGGENHRFGLFDMILIKDNHVDVAGGIQAAIDAAHAYLSEQDLSIPIEIEVRNFGEMEEALSGKKIDRIMLDNFTPEQTREAVARIAGAVEIESSGGITFDTILSYAEAGVDFISVGALTHSVKSLDLSLKVKL